jgi:hypothetical protein
MHEILISLTNLFGEQSLAISALADQISALRESLVHQFPEIEDDLNARLSLATNKGEARVEKLQETLATLRELISRVSN